MNTLLALAFLAPNIQACLAERINPQGYAEVVVDQKCARSVKAQDARNEVIVDNRRLYIEMALASFPAETRAQIIKQLEK